MFLAPGETLGDVHGAYDPPPEQPGGGDDGTAGPAPPDKPSGKRRGARKTFQVLYGTVGLALVFGGGVMLGSGWKSQGPPQAPAASSVTPVHPTVEAKPMARSIPTHIKIPKIHVSAPIEKLGLNPDHTVEVPPLNKPNLAGWYKYGPTPGQKGPAVVLGHVDSHQTKAVFFELGRLRSGDKVRIARSNGSTITFVIDTVTRVPKNDFPTQKVYGKIDYPGLRLVTCGGDYNSDTHHYEDNTIVYAHLVH